MKLGGQFKCEHCNHPVDHAATDWEVKQDKVGPFIGHTSELGCMAARERFHQQMVADGQRPDWNPDLGPGNNDGRTPW